jgi:nucleotide-binding universal stress UspA family protein
MAQVSLTKKDVNNETPIAIKKILMPIDRSGYSEKILAYGISLGKTWGAELTAIHVIDPGRGVPGGRVKEKEMEREEQAKREGMLALDAINPMISKQGINIKKEVIEKSDSIAKAIIGYAKQNDYDVIIVGTKGMTTVEEFFLGSVANNVIHHAHCPVFAIR